MQHLKLKFLCYPGQSLGALGRGTNLVHHSEQFGEKSRRFFVSCHNRRVNDPTWIPRLVRGIQGSRPGIRSLDPADTPRDVGKLDLPGDCDRVRFFAEFTMTWGIMVLLALLFCSPVISLAAQKHDLRNTRHCEVILFNPKFKLSVYSTIGLNACPETSWVKMTVSRVKQETGVFFAYLSGPRYLVIDDFENPLIAKSASRLLGGIQMREAAVLHPNLMDIIRGAEPYREHIVERRTTWIYQAGHPVYALINPKGQVFVMQSYSVEISPLTQAALADLGTQLVLPKGWRFRTTVLTKDMHLTTVDNKSVVILDSLLNSYQLTKNDFLQ